MRLITLRLAYLLAFLVLLAQSGYMLFAQPPVPAGEKDALGGPQVQDRSAESLVRTDMQGRWQGLEVRPEEAAVNLMNLDPIRREKAHAVIADRAASIRKHLVANIDLIKTSTDAIRSGDMATAQRLSKELYDRFDLANERDPLEAPLGAVLTPSECVEMRRLIDEYWNAWISAEKKATPDQTSEAIQKRLSMGQFQREVQAAYEYTLRPFQQKLEAIYTAVDPTPEQRSAIRAAVIDYIRDGQLTPNLERREVLVKTIYESLDEPRRIKLFGAALSAL